MQCIELVISETNQGGQTYSELKVIHESSLAYIYGQVTGLSIKIEQLNVFFFVGPFRADSIGSVIVTSSCDNKTHLFYGHTLNMAQKQCF